MTETSFCIGIDNISPGESTAPGAPGGMRTYLRELLMRLPGAGQGVTIKLFTPDWNADFGPLPEAVSVVRLPGVPRSRVARIWFQHTALPAAIRRESPDVFLATATVAPPRTGVPVVLAVQFLQFYAFPEAYGRARTTYLRWAVPRSVRQAARVIVFTEFQRNELCAHMPCDPGKIAIVPHGINHEALGTPASAQERAEICTLVGGRPFILYVSATYRYKNHLGLIEAFGRLKRQTRFPHVLVLVGAEEAVSADELRARALSAGVAGDVLILGRLPSVTAAYQSADLFAFPSLYETFGFPVLEAMAAGCPVVASDRGATAELVGEAGVRADPEDPAAFADAMARVLDNSADRPRACAQGRIRASEFTWARTAERTFQALVEAARR